jgi:hypothetical protein
LRPLIIELNALESQGLDLVAGGNAIRVKVLASVLTADSLFLNGIMGFVQSFVAYSSKLQYQCVPFSSVNFSGQHVQQARYSQCDTPADVSNNKTEIG